MSNYFTRAQTNPRLPANLPNPYPEYKTPDVAGTLDAVFNQYLAARQAQRQEALAPGQLLAQQQQIQLGGQQLAAGQRDAAMSDLKETAQFGAPVASPMGQENMNRAAAGITQGPGDDAGKERLRKFAEGFSALSAQTGQGARLTEAKIAETGADTRLKDARAANELAKAGARGTQHAQDGPEIVTKDGQQFIVNRDANGNKRYSANPGSQIQSEIGTKVGLSQDGIENLDYIGQVLRSPEGQKLAMKAGGDFDRLKSFNDPAAEKLANAILQAGDAEARVKTGASYNENELRDYFKKLVNPVGTMEGNLDRLARKKAFFAGQLKIYGQGRNIPGRESPTQDGGIGIQTRTLKDGSTVRVKSNGKGGWVEVN